MVGYTAGEIVAVSAGPFGAITHVGIRTGLGTVISNSKKLGYVAEETLEDFSGGEAVRSLGYPGDLSPVEVVSQARSLLGKRWSLTDNCEHFVTWAHGLKPGSKQLQTILLFLIVGSAVVWLARS